MTGNADDVAHIQQLKETEGSLTDGIELYVKLEAGAISLNMREAGFAVKPQGQNATGSAHIYAISFEACGAAPGVGRYDLSRCRALLEFMRVGIIAERFDFGELFLALEVLVERLERQGGFPFVLLPQYTDAFLGASRKRLC
jgi:hypothetical protein